MSNFTVSPNQAKKFIKKCMKVQEVPLLKSAPGMGKSDLIRSIADELGLLVIDVRLAQIEAVEMNGYPDLAGEYATYKQMDIFPTQKTPIPAGYNGFLIFLDELTQAKKDVQGAAHKLILDRMVGQEKLHDMAFIVAAGNRSQDRAASTGLITSLQSRLIHLTLHVDFENDFFPYALNEGYDPRILSFLNFRTDAFNNFDPLHSGDTYACSRTWFKLHKLIKDEPEIGHSWVPLIAGTIGEGAAAEFKTFCGIWQSLPEVASITSNPSGANLPSDSQTKYAMIGMLTTKVTKENLPSFVTYVRRMEPELQLVFVRLVAKGFIEALRVPEFSKLLRDFTEEMRAYS
jgi:hypothetical protein